MLRGLSAGFVQCWQHMPLRAAGSSLALLDDRHALDTRSSAYQHRDFGTESTEPLRWAAAERWGCCGHACTRIRTQRSCLIRLSTNGALVCSPSVQALGCRPGAAIVFEGRVLSLRAVFCSQYRRPHTAESRDVGCHNSSPSLLRPGRRSRGPAAIAAPSTPSAKTLKLSGLTRPVMLARHLEWCQACAHSLAIELSSSP